MGSRLSARIIRCRRVFIFHLNFSLRPQANGSSFQKGLTQALSFHFWLSPFRRPFDSGGVHGWLWVWACITLRSGWTLFVWMTEVEHGNQFNTSSGKVGNCCGSTEDKYNSFENISPFPSSWRTGQLNWAFKVSCIPKSLELYESYSFNTTICGIGLVKSLMQSFINSKNGRTYIAS